MSNTVPAGVKQDGEMIKIVSLNDRTSLFSDQGEVSLYRMQYVGIFLTPKTSLRVVKISPCFSG